jgi:hypothetical protein
LRDMHLVSQSSTFHHITVFSLYTGNPWARRKFFFAQARRAALQKLQSHIGHVSYSCSDFHLFFLWQFFPLLVFLILANRHVPSSSVLQCRVLDVRPQDSQCEPFWSCIYYLDLTACAGWIFSRRSQLLEVTSFRLLLFRAITGRCFLESIHSRSAVSSVVTLHLKHEWYKVQRTWCLVFNKSQIVHRSVRLEWSWSMRSTALVIETSLPWLWHETRTEVSDLRRKCASCWNAALCSLFLPLKKMEQPRTPAARPAPEAICSIHWEENKPHI